MTAGPPGGAGERPFGEVVQSSISGFVAQCHRLEDPPVLGSLVTTNDGGTKIYAVVCNATTGSIDPGRRSMALGQGEAEEEGVYRSHPELAQLLRTDFEALIVGCQAESDVRYSLPPRPARIHAFVHAASTKQLCEFTAPLRFLHFLMNASAPTRDDALASCLRLASAAHPDPKAFLLQAGKELANLLGRDTPRLNIILRQLEV